ncbi:MAG: hypothetical protein N4A71_03740 [Carboxylicivirga sp.]|nr:hypothetical protein [Carboxylicivirga sp.]
MPISVYLQECENLLKRGQLDFTQLAERGLTMESLNRLELLTDALRYTEANWQEVKSERQEAHDNWKKKAPALYELRDELLDTLEFAFREDSTLLEHIERIKEGDSHADTIQDMARLAVLGKDNPALVEAINYPATKFDEADNMAETMANVLAQANGYMYGDNEMKLLRDKTFTLLDKEVTNIRAYGRFVFRKDKDHVKAYYSKYQRERSIAYRNSKKEQSE